MVSNLLEADVETVLDAAVSGDDEEVIVVDPSAETVASLVDAATDRDGLPSMSMLADDRVLTAVMSDFLAASTAADLVADGALGIRLLPDDVDNALFASPSRVLVLVSADDRVAALSTDDEEFVTEVFETNRAAFEDADEYDLRTPAISRVRETMAAEIDEATRDDFDALLAAVDAAGGSAEIDEVTASLLVAAKNDVLLYDISKWGEDVGIASKATFSRTKTRLEDAGLIDTEKVPIDVGRPRLRLKLGDDRLHGADAAELADVAVDTLS
ncbi:transcriptional regulator TbsP [Halorubrum pallidum]|uniref:Transcriptional regulator TbsP n=1 Tax=Halorubrum pallidum TaxID=1526114 RepID=A0ABD5T3N7_9EURY